MTRLKTMSRWHSSPKMFLKTLLKKPSEIGLFIILLLGFLSIFNFDKIKDFVYFNYILFFFIALAFIYYFFLIVFLVKGRDPKINFTPSGEPQLPQELNPAEMEMVFKKVMTRNGIYGLLLYLENLGYWEIKVEKFTGSARNKILLQFIQKKLDSDIHDQTLNLAYNFVFTSVVNRNDYDPRKYLSAFVDLIHGRLSTTVVSKKIYSNYVLNEAYRSLYLPFPFFIIVTVIAFSIPVLYFQYSTENIEWDFIFAWYIVSFIFLIPMLKRFKSKRTEDGAEMKQQIISFIKKIKEISKTGFGDLSVSSNSREYFFETLPFMVALGYEKVFIKAMAPQINMSVSELSDLKLKIKTLKNLKNARNAQANNGLVFKRVSKYGIKKIYQDNRQELKQTEL